MPTKITSRSRCRCRKCRHVQTLKKPPSTYYRIPKCTSCGATDWRLEPKKTKQQTHWCGRYWFPHRVGSCNSTHDPYYGRFGPDSADGSDT